MKLRELKCKNCGAVINVEENASKVECEYCHTSFAVDDAYSDGYKFEKGRIKAQSEHLEKNMENVKTAFKPIEKIFAVQYVICFIIFIVIIGVIIFSVIKQGSSVSDFDLNKFNSIYEMYSGSEFGMGVKSIIDEASTNNKKDKEHQITIKYGDINTKEPEKMKEIKKEIFDMKNYEVSLEYDDDGFIYMIIIEDFE